MRGLFEVWFIDLEDEGAKITDTVIANDEANAKIKVWQEAATYNTRLKDIDEYHCIVRRIGDVPAKRKVQEVKVVKD